MELKWSTSRLGYGLFLLLSVWAIGGVVLHSLEGWKWVDSFYTAAITMTTVGYGDFTPTHDITKIFLIVYAFSGIGITLYVLSLAAGHYFERRFEMRVLTRAKKEHLPLKKLSRIFESEL